MEILVVTTILISFILGVLTFVYNLSVAIRFHKKPQLENRGARFVRRLIAIIFLCLYTFNFYYVIKVLFFNYNPSIDITVVFFLCNLGGFLGSISSNIIHLHNTHDTKNSSGDDITVVMSKITHDIRTPMNTITGITEIITQRKDIPEDMKEQLANISSASSSLLNVINNLIDYSKLESNSLELFEYDYSTRDFIVSLIESAEKIVGEGNVEFISDVDTNIPSVLYGDDVRIHQIITNLLNNAARYTSVGVITMHLKAKVIGNNCNFIFSIEDTGDGIKDDLKNDIFDNGLKACKDAGSDTTAGLAMIISNQLVKLLNGDMNMTYVPGTGTTIHIEIPQRIIVSEGIGEIVTEKKVKTKERYMFTVPMARVLVVDDNIVNLFVAKELISKYEIEVDTATSGSECLDKLNENYYDLIFMDYVMPEMDGHETLVKIRRKSNDHLKRIPVVALTAQIASGNERLYIDEGFQGYLGKPINVDELETQFLRFLPKEYITYKDGAGANIKDSIDNTSWYTRIESVLNDININKGIEYCNNDYNSYMSLLKTVNADSVNTLNKISQSIDESVLEDYRIAVHALKSVSASLGADELSAFCLEHENAAKNDDIPFILESQAKLINDYKSLIHKIEIVLRRETVISAGRVLNNKKTGTSSEIKNIAEQLKTALEDYNLDDCEALIEKLEKFKLSEKQESVLSTSKEYLTLFKYDEAAGLISDAFGV